MKTSRLMAVAMALSLVLGTLVFAQKAMISITSITANHRITGTVVGLPEEDYVNFKVIVYVHTDQWYIHPYAGQDEGKSWASVEAGGNWQIQTVQREFKADKIAALLVKRNYPEPSRTESLERIQSTAKVEKKLKDTSDYGKL
jgi:hypothetical protein